MLSKASKPTKSDILRSLQGTKESDILLIEPVTPDGTKKVSEQISKLAKSSGFVSVIIVKQT